MSVDPMIQALTGPQPYYVVLRTMSAMGKDRVRGEVVDTSEKSRHKVNTLVDRRYLFQFPYGLQVPDVDDDGRPMHPDAIVNGPSQEAA